MLEGNLTYDGVSIFVERTEKNIEFLNEVVKILPDFEFNDNSDKIEIFNNENIFFKEIEFIEDNKINFIFSRLADKDYNQPITILENDLNIKNISFDDKHKYFPVITDNIIDGIEKDELKVSVQSLNYFSKKSKKVKQVVNLYILLFLCNKTYYPNNDFEFTVYSENSFFKNKLILDEIDVDLFQFYEWIISKELTDSVNIKLEIVRKIIVDKQTFNLKEIDLLNCKGIFNRIISGRVDTYFNQLNILKNDFVNFNTSFNKIKNALGIKLLTWFGSIGLVVFDFVRGYDRDNLWYDIFFYKSEKVQVILVMLLVAVIFIYLIYWIEMNSLKKEYKDLDNFYSKEQYFDENIFKKFVNEPKTSKLIGCLIGGIIIVLLIRFFV